MSKTMHHAAISLLVTSLTTAAALYANIVSDITDIKGFGITAGTALVVNYFLVITWIPSAIILIEKFDQRFLSDTKCCTCFEKFIEFLRNISVQIFHKILPKMVSKVWFLWIIIFLALGVGGIVVTFAAPKLELPSSKDFALFKKDTVIEQWFLKLKYNFRFFQVRDGTAGGLGLNAMFGVNGKDTGDHLDPDSIGDLEFDSSFDLSEPDAQQWMLQFCHNLKNASIADHTSMTYKQCSLDLFNSLVTKSCEDLKNEIKNTAPTDFDFDSGYLDGCCGHSSTPIPADDFKKCYLAFTPVISSQYDIYSLLGVAYFDLNTKAMKAYRFAFTGTQSWSANYDVMDPLYKDLQDWMDHQMSSAPSSLKQGWLAAYYDEFELYDLQRALAFGTYTAIGVSMACAFVVMLITSLNVLITIYAIFTIFLTISVTSGVLVLLGWELNIVESVTLTMAVGLSIDFCIHYGMGYRLSKKGNRGPRVQESFEKVGAAIFMAAATTFIAGACITPSIILFYIQLGTFLMLVMAVSWLFATFFFQSPCYIIGPKFTFCQIPSPCQALSKKESEAGKVSPTHYHNERPPVYTVESPKHMRPMHDTNRMSPHKEPSHDNKAFEGLHDDMQSGDPRYNMYQLRAQYRSDP